MRIAHVSTFPPIKCGIASFAADLIGAIPNAEHMKYSLHYGLNEVKDCVGNADVRSPQQLVSLAKAISASDCDVVSIQHEFGIWGGREGEHIYAFLENLSKPFVSVLHTTFNAESRSSVQGDIIRELVHGSSRVIALTEVAKANVEGLLGESIPNLVVIPHGVPDISYVAPPAIWNAARNDGRSTLKMITPGFFREDKGFEAILLALRRLKKEGISISYVIAGEPQRQFNGQGEYYAEILTLIADLGLESIATIEASYLSVDDQVRAIQACHVGIFAYQDPCLSSSGTMPLVLSAGRPVICTPFAYANDKKKTLCGVTLADRYCPSAIATSIKEFMSQSSGYVATTEEIYARTREWSWREIGCCYLQQYAFALRVEIRV